MARTCTRRNFLETAGASAAAFLAAPLFAASRQPGGRKPNIILILADDLGWADTSFTGSRFYDTPNIERLARRGVFFPNAYAASPLCSPTRASIMTGQSPARTGITTPSCHVPQEIFQARVQPSAPPTERQLGCISATRLKLEYYTLAEALKSAGYATGHFGKWHLGREPYDPLHQGFDVDIPHWYGPGPAGSYVAPWKFPNFKPRTPHEHIEDRMGDEAIAFIEKHKDGPFFVNYWQFSVHAPFDAKRAYIEAYEKRVDPNEPQHCPTYAAMVRSLDDNVGKMLDALDRLGIADNTIVIFFSDNGGNMYNNVHGSPPTSNKPLRGGKASLYEGGIREPAVVVWPGVVRPGTRNEALIQSEDLYPTILDMAGVRTPPAQACDGFSVVPALRGQKPLREAVYCYFPHAPRVPEWLPPAVCVRKGNWKLIRVFFDGPDGRHRYELYDLERDIGERHNLAAKHPDKVRELDALIDAFLSRTGAVLPQPNPRYKPDAVDVIGGWRASDNRRIRLNYDPRWKAMHCRVFERGGFVAPVADLTLPPGRYRLVAAIRSWVDARAQVRWAGDPPGKERTGTVLLRGDTLSHEYAVDIDAKEGLKALRFVPCTDAEGTLFIERFRLLDASGKSAKEWSFSNARPRRARRQPVVGGWRAGGNGHAACSIRNGSLHIVCTNNDPMIMTARPLNLPPGKYVLRMRMQAKARGAGQVLIRPAERGYLPGTGTPFAVEHDGEWREITVTFKATHPIHEMRIDPCAGKGTIDIDWISLATADGRVVKKWDFGAR